MTKVVLIEVNEVPNPVLDAYAKRSPFMAKFLRSSRRFETVAADQLQLDPWIAWPTFHRGVPDITHRMLRLGQDSAPADRQYPPIWQSLVASGVSVGVYGSLFSSAETDLSKYAFFVPDVFSPHARVKPEYLEAFQGFNLDMTRASGRNPDKGMGGAGAASLLGLAARGQFRASTLARIVAQVVSEKIKPSRLSRRRNIQTDLHADVFLSLWKKTRPDFATFYTNNVAASMHRFWSAAFPDGSINKDSLDEKWIETYSGEIGAALYSVERLLRELVSLDDPPVIVLASAIGQEEIPATNHSAFVSIVDIARFMRAITPETGSSEFELLPTMVPDFSIRFRSEDTAKAFCGRLAGLVIGGETAVKTLERMKSTGIEFDQRVGHAHVKHIYDADNHFKHAVTYEASDAVTVHLSVQIDDFAGDRTVFLNGRQIAFEDAGVGEVVHAEGVNCTAQHSSIGALAIHGGRTAASDSSVVSVLDFVPSVLGHFGISSGNMLPGKASMQFA